MDTFLLSILFGVVTMFSWGIGDLLAAISSRKIGFFKTYFWMKILGTVLVSVFLFRTKEQISLQFNFIFPLFISALFEFIATLTYFKGFTIGLVSVVSPIGSSWSMITAILAIVFFKEILSINALFAVFLIILGIWLVGSDIRVLLGKKKFNFEKGGKEGLIAMFCWGLMAFFFIYPSKISGGWYLPIMIQRFFTVLIAIFYSNFFKKDFALKKKEISVLKIIVPVGLLDALGFFGVNAGSLIGQASIVSPVSSAYTVVTIILSVIFLKEKLVSSQIFGIISVIAGIIMLSV